jgi:hypothetical protein
MVVMVATHFDADSLRRRRRRDSDAEAEREPGGQDGP